MRKPRLLVPGARYHVTARAHRSVLIFEPSSTKGLFLDIVARAKQRFDFRLENFCLMGNHFHMVIRPGATESLSSILQWILSVFAMAWNRLHGLTGQGAVWAQRFYSRVLATLADYLRTSSYIDENPVTAGLVGKPEEWPFCARGMRARGDPWVLSLPLDGMGRAVDS